MIDDRRYSIYNKIPTNKYNSQKYIIFIIYLTPPTPPTPPTLPILPTITQ
jgi:hypothetical protein